MSMTARTLVAALRRLLGMLPEAEGISFRFFKSWALVHIAVSSDTAVQTLRVALDLGAPEAMRAIEADARLRWYLTSQRAHGNLYAGVIGPPHETAPVMSGDAGTSRAQGTAAVSIAARELAAALREIAGMLPEADGVSFDRFETWSFVHITASSDAAARALGVALDLGAFETATIEGVDGGRYLASRQTRGDLHIGVAGPLHKQKSPASSDDRKILRVHQHERYARRAQKVAPAPHRAARCSPDQRDGDVLSDDSYRLARRMDHRR
jgi:hypothetical protein